MTVRHLPCLTTNLTVSSNILKVDTYADLAGLSPAPGDIVEVLDEFKLYIWDGATWNPVGVTGAAATVAVGSTTTLPPSSPATVVNSGTTSAAILDFGIPKGETGSPGVDGNKWLSGSGAPSNLIGNDGDYYLNTVDNSTYIKQSGTWVHLSTVYGNIDGGLANSIYGGIDPIDGGGAI